jgi:hypothetical protein
VNLFYKEEIVSSSLLSFSFMAFFWMIRSMRNQLMWSYHKYCQDRSNIWHLGKHNSVYVCDMRYIFVVPTCELPGTNSILFCMESLFWLESYLSFLRVLPKSSCTHFQPIDHISGLRLCLFGSEILDFWKLTGGWWNFDFDFLASCDFFSFNNTSCYELPNLYH